jgi:hypothetical protein
VGITRRRRGSGGAVPRAEGGVPGVAPPVTSPEVRGAPRLIHAGKRGCCAVRREPVQEWREGTPSPRRGPECPTHERRIRARAVLVRHQHRHVHRTRGGVPGSRLAGVADVHVRGPDGEQLQPRQHGVHRSGPAPPVVPDRDPVELLLGAPSHPGLVSAALWRAGRVARRDAEAHAPGRRRIVRRGALLPGHGLAGARPALQPHGSLGGRDVPLRPDDAPRGPLRRVPVRELPAAVRVSPVALVARGGGPAAHGRGFHVLPRVHRGRGARREPGVRLRLAGRPGVPRRHRVHVRRAHPPLPPGRPRAGRVADRPRAPGAGPFRRAGPRARGAARGGAPGRAGPAGRRRRARDQQPAHVRAALARGDPRTPRRDAGPARRLWGARRVPRRRGPHREGG